MRGRRGVDMQRELALIESIMTHLNRLGLTRTREAEEHQLYTMRHKIAFMKVQLKLTGTITMSGVLHDTDKLVLYGLCDTVKEASKIHRMYAKHHIENCSSESDLSDCVIDYECARFTKPDKPLNAYNTINKYQPDYMSKLQPILERYGICSPVNVQLRLDKLEEYMLETFYNENIVYINGLYNDIKQGKSGGLIVKEYYGIM